MYLCVCVHVVCLCVCVCVYVMILGPTALDHTKDLHSASPVVDVDNESVL